MTSFRRHNHTKLTFIASVIGLDVLFAVTEQCQSIDLRYTGIVRNKVSKAHYIVIDPSPADSLWHCVVRPQRASAHSGVTCLVSLSGCSLTSSPDVNKPPASTVCQYLCQWCCLCPWEGSAATKPELSGNYSGQIGHTRDFPKFDSSIQCHFLVGTLLLFPLKQGVVVDSWCDLHIHHVRLSGRAHYVLCRLQWKDFHKSL